MKEFLDKVAKSKSKTLYVADETRLARKLSVQEQALEVLRKRGIKVVSASDPRLFSDDTPEGVLRLQMMGAISEYEHKKTIAKLKNGRENKRKVSKVTTLVGVAKVEGRKNFLAEHPGLPGIVGSMLKRPFSKLQLKTGLRAY